MYLWVCLFHAILYPLSPYKWDEGKRERKYVDFSLFSAKAFSVSCCYYNDGNNNIGRSISSHFCNFMSASRHKSSNLNIYELSLLLLILSCSKFMVSMLQFTLFLYKTIYASGIKLHFDFLMGRLFGSWKDLLNHSRFVHSSWSSSTPQTVKNRASFF